MDSTIRVLMPTEVPGVCDHADYPALEVALERHVDTLRSRLDLDVLAGWLLTLWINSRSTDGIGVSKRVRRYPSACEFVISISVPVPDSEQVSWGVGPPARPPFFHPLDAKHFWMLAPQFERYDSLAAFVLDASRQAIELAFTKGMTCHGRRIGFRRGA